MAKVTTEVETLYDRGDVVIFNLKDLHLAVGIICGYYVDYDAGSSVWYDVAISKDSTLDYAHGGDVAEFDILGKISDPNTIKKVFGFVQKGEISVEDQTQEDEKGDC